MKLKSKVFSVLFSIALLLIVGQAIFWTTRITIVNSAQVRSKEMVIVEGRPTFMVFTDKGTYKVEDSSFHLVWNSSDVYSDLEPKECFDLETIGYRVPFLSMHPNILRSRKSPCLKP